MLLPLKAMFWVWGHPARFRVHFRFAEEKADVLVRTILVLVGCVAATARAADPWADHVVSYVPGAVNDPEFVKPEVTLGSPERYTGEGVYPAAITPFNPAWRPNEIVSIGAGGSLVLRFDEPVMDDAMNPFGIDLLVFGNAGFAGSGFPVVAGPLFGASRNGLIEVSQDGLTWIAVPGIQPDGLFPTLGYLDHTDPFATETGQVPSDFTRPVDPLFSATGLTMTQVVAGYAGSGGGAGIDLGALGLSSASYVRLTHTGLSGDFQLDAVSDVSPIPGPMSVLALAGLTCLSRRRSPRTM